MNNYVTASTIKALREKSKLTQSDLAEIIGVTDKAVSKWETAEIKFAFTVISMVCFPKLYK